MRVADKVTLVTGVAGDIGAATALRFAEAGARLITTDIKTPPAEVTQAIDNACSDHLFISCDLTDADQVGHLFAEISKRFGRIDILVNIAGGDLGMDTDFEDIDADNLQRNLDVNLKTTVYCCQEAVKLMKEQGGGSIVNMTSMTHRGSSANQFAYSASKGGVYALTRTLAMTLGQHGIRVNAVAPGMIEVGTIVNNLPDGVWEQVSKMVGGTYPLGRVGQPIEVANCMLFLASDEASFVTGEVMEISGGGRL